MEWTCILLLFAVQLSNMGLLLIAYINVRKVVLLDSPVWFRTQCHCPLWIDSSGSFKKLQLVTKFLSKKTEHFWHLGSYLNWLKEIAPLAIWKVIEILDIGWPVKLVYMPHWDQICQKWSFQRELDEGKPNIIRTSFRVKSIYYQVRNNRSFYGQNHGCYYFLLNSSLKLVWTSVIPCFFLYTEIWGKYIILHYAKHQNVLVKWTVAHRKKKMNISLATCFDLLLLFTVWHMFSLFNTSLNKERLPWHWQGLEDKDERGDRKRI